MQKQVIEFAGVPVGIAIRDGEELQFMAVKYNVIGLDGQRFRTLGDIRFAIRQHVSRFSALAA